MTTIGEIIEEELARFQAETGRENLRILEVGVLRDPDAVHAAGDGHSTLAFTRYLARHGGTYTGIDLSVAAARAAVEEAGTQNVCAFLEGDSEKTLYEIGAQGAAYDVIYLDADNSGASSMREYLLALKILARPGLILADDMNLGHPEVRKGRVIRPYLDEEGARYRIRQRRTPWDTRDILVQEIS